MTRAKARQDSASGRYMRRLFSGLHTRRIVILVIERDRATWADSFDAAIEHLRASRGPIRVGIEAAEWWNSTLGFLPAFFLALWYWTVGVPREAKGR